MKYFYKFTVLISAALFLAAGNTFPQWFIQQSGTDEFLYSVYFTDEFNGTVVGTGGTILRTTDGGNNWVSQLSGTSKVLLDVYFIDAGNGFVVGDYGLILRTINGGNNWVHLTSGTNYTLYAVSFSDVNTGTAVGSEGVILRTTDGGQQWRFQVSNTYYPLYDVSFKDALHGVIVGGSLTILRTTDGGETWIDESLRAPHELLAVSFSDVNKGTAVGYYSVILKTTDGGQNWVYQTNETGLWWYGVSFTDENTGTAVSDFGTIIRTTDGGQNWIQQQSGTYAMLEDVCFTDANHGTAVGDSGIILRTVDGGVPVELVSFSAEFVNDAVVLKWQTGTESNNRGFDIERQQPGGAEIPPEGGFSVSNWKKIGFVEGAGTTTEPQSYSYTDDNIFEGICKYRLKQIDYDGSFRYSKEIEVVVKSTPKDYILYQNYPNPFNPVTAIKYSLALPSAVQIKVFDILGNEIVTLVSEEKPAGNYEVIFDASDLVSGVYFYQIKAGSFIDTKKMVLLK